MIIKNAESPIEIVWDKSGIPHVFAKSIADAYRGMGYVSGKERLWQTHQSTAYANCEAAALLGEKFVISSLYKLWRIYITICKFKF